MKYQYAWGKLFIFSLIIFAVFSCSDSEKRLSPFLNQTKVILDLGLPQMHAANDNTVWDKIRRFFVRDAVAQSAPAAFSSILVRVSGPDIGLTEQSFLPADTVTLNVASGSFRQFDVTAFVAGGSPSAALSFRGLAIADLPAGQTVSVPVFMALNETKIVIPDGNNGRVIMLDDLSSAASTWTIRTNADWGVLFETVTLTPYDISFDTRGRIYIANNASNGVIRIDDINGTNPVIASATVFNLLAGNPVPFVVTIAVDKVNNLVYFATTSALYRANLNGTNTTTVDLSKTPITPANYNIRGIDIDSSGMMYIVASPISAFPSLLVKFDPVKQALLGVYNTTPLFSPWDVIVRLPYIYVANFGGANGAPDIPANGNQLLQFTWDSSLPVASSFTLLSHYGRKQSVVDNLKGHFYGASRFLAIRNDSLIIGDNDQQGGGLDQLVSLSDLLGSNWNTFGQHGSTTTPGDFILYSFC